MTAHETWLKEFAAETSPTMGDPFFACLAAAIASVECGWGDAALHEKGMLNEIGYKAVAGHPSASKATLEAAGLVSTRARFRLFKDRVEQAESLRYLLRSSYYYDAARLMFILTFYAGYAPGRVDGILCVVENFNKIAASGAHPGVNPIRFTDAKLIKKAGLSDADIEMNLKAIRDGADAFCELCRKCGRPLQDR